MKKDVLINIKGIQSADGQKDESELFTNGIFGGKNGNYYILYDESEATGFAGCHAMIKAEGDKKVTLSRSGNVKSLLTIERNRRNIGHYAIPQGNIMVGISAKDIKNSLTDSGGELYLRYAVDINSSHISSNEVYITIKEAKGE